MKNSLLYGLAIIALTLLTACGSTTRVARDLLITSEPAGATIFLDGDKVGETPLKVKTFFTWNQSEIYDSLLRRVVQVKKEGYESQTRDLYPIDMPTLHFLLNRENLGGGKP
jgi:hypothetical protein